MADFSPDASQAEAFLAVLGKDPLTTRLRAFPAKGSANKAQVGPRKGRWDQAQAEVWNLEGRGIYAVIGNGGDDTASITSCPALFVEWDDKPIDWQINAWQELGLPEPSIQVSTGGKSIHTYWVLTAPIGRGEWEPLQGRLIDHCGGDKNCKDAPRVMRLPGFAYIGPDDQIAGLVELLHVNDHRYTAAELEACLPELMPAADPMATPLPRGLGLVAGDCFPPRGMDEICKALACIPTRSPGSYEMYRRALAGLIAAVEQSGGSEAQAIALMEGHCPSDISGWNVAQVARSSTTREAATFWAIAAEHGYDLTRYDLKRRPSISSSQPGSPETTAAKRRKLATDEVMAYLPVALGRLRLNTRSGDIEADGRPLFRNEISRLYLRLSGVAENWPKETTADAVIELAGRSSFDPVAEYLESLEVNPLPVGQWQCLDQHLLGIEDPIASAFLPRFLVSAVARVFEPGCDCRQLPVLTGAQWRGKSALGRILFGATNWVEGIGDLGKDALLKAHTAWGVELAELDGVTRRADQESLKAFISETADTIRKPYDRSPERFPRRFVFWGTSNGTPLRDLTGNSRYVCIPIPDRMLPLDWAQTNRDAIWARALAEYRAGMTWADCSEEERQAIAERNIDHRETDPWSERIDIFLENRQRAGDLPVQVPAVLEHLGVTTDRQNNALAQRIKGVAESIGWEWRQRRDDQGKRRKGLWPRACINAMPDTTGAPSDTTGDTPSLPSECLKSWGVSPPSPPIPKKLEFEREVAAAPAKHSAACAVSTFGAFGGDGGGEGFEMLQTPATARTFSDTNAVVSAVVTGPPVVTPASLQANKVFPDAPPNRLVPGFEPGDRIYVVHPMRPLGALHLAQVTKTIGASVQFRPPLDGLMVDPTEPDAGAFKLPEPLSSASSNHCLPELGIKADIHIGAFELNGQPWQRLVWTQPDGGTTTWEVPPISCRVEALDEGGLASFLAGIGPQ